MKSEDIIDKLKEMKKNTELLQSCKVHNFGKCELSGNPFTDPKVKCLNCGGELKLTHIGMYIKGYVAAGGNGRDVADNKYFENLYK